MYLDGLEPLDRQILELLISNARLTYSEIGTRVGVSRVAVRAHVEALERAGVIEAYTAVVNPQKLSGAVSVYLEVEASPETLSEVTAQLEASPTVTQLYRMTGGCCLHVHAVAPDQPALERFLREEIDRLPGLRSVRTHVFLERIMHVTGLRL